TNGLASHSAAGLVGSQNVPLTSSMVAQLREPSVLDTVAPPQRWVTEGWVSPLRPRLVVITTTPLAALEPYSAAAEAPLSTSRVSMSFGFRSEMRLTGLSWLGWL